MTDVRSDRRADTTAPIAEILAMRWSPRSFDPAATLGDEQVASLLEAARWAASGLNRQPYRFLVGRRGTTTFDRVERHLMGFNRAWAPNASLLVVAVVLTEADGEPNPWADYDTGQAMANLAAQAHELGLQAHAMGGVDVDGLRAEFGLPAAWKPLTVTAVGRVAPADALPERYRERETAPRSRLAVADLVLQQD